MGLTFTASASLQLQFPSDEIRGPSLSVSGTPRSFYVALLHDSQFRRPISAADALVYQAASCVI